MFEITKEFHLSASHQLAGLPDTHPCSRLHGHNYIVRLHLAAEEPDEVGFVMDYRRLDRFKTYLDNQFDHRHLNDLLDFNPTAEHLARHFYHYAQDELGVNLLVAVAVSETPKTWATYRPEVSHAG